MRFCRRTEGTSSARSVFKKGREDKRSSYRKRLRSVLSTLIIFGKKAIFDLTNKMLIEKWAVFIE